MSTTPPPDRPLSRRWTAFWFTPADPTALGFIRIVTGLLILYTHLAYTLDLQGFFGKFGWYGADYIERERNEFPWRVSPFMSWDDELPPPRAPEFPHRRQAFMEWVRSLPPTQEGRTRALRYLDRIAREDNPETAGYALALLTRLIDIPAFREKLLTRLEDGQQSYSVAGDPIPQDTPPATRHYAPFFPPVFLLLSAEERKAIAADLRAFLAVLPEDVRKSGYVRGHLADMDQPHRMALAQFLMSLPDDPTARERRIEYFEYWNNDSERVYRQGHYIVSVWFHVTDPTQMALIHGFTLAVMVLFTIGFCTRVTSVLTWIMVIGYIHRTNQILFGMDTMMNILLLYLTIGNSGAALSVDRLIARYRAVRASLARSGTIDEPTRAFLSQAPPSVGANFGIRLIQIHFCFIYMAAGLSKLKGPAWWNGTAFWDVMINPEFTLMKYQWFEQMVRLIAEIKPLYYTITAIGVWFTWGLEIAFPFLVWTRLRPVVMWLAVLLHAGIGILMGLNLFELMMMTMLLVFIPHGVIRDRLRVGPGLPKLGFGFQPSDPVQTRAAAPVAAADVDGQVTLSSAKDRTGTTVTTPAGTVVRGPEGVAALVRSLRLLRLFRFAPLIPGVGSLMARRLVPSVPGPATASTPKSGPQTPAAAS